jgi:hypothetical protein
LFKIGADDWQLKPFGMAELVAGCAAFVRALPAPLTPALSQGDAKGHSYHLTGIATRLLRLNNQTNLPRTGASGSANSSHPPLPPARFWCSFFFKRQGSCRISEILNRASGQRPAKIRFASTSWPI